MLTAAALVLGTGRQMLWYDHSWHQFPGRSTTSQQHVVSTIRRAPTPAASVHCTTSGPPSLRAFLRLSASSAYAVSIYPGAVPLPQGASEPAAMSEQSLGSLPGSGEPHYCLKDRPWITTSKTSRLPNPMMILDRNRMGKVAICPAMKNWRPCSVKMTRSRPMPSLMPEPDENPVEMTEEDIEDLEDPEPIESLAPDTEEQN